MKSVSPGALRQVNRNFRRPLFDPDATSRFIGLAIEALAVAEAAGDTESVRDLLRLIHATKRLSLVRAA